MRTVKYILALSAGFLLLTLSLNAQIFNDECRFATFIPDTEDYCDIFNLGGATMDNSVDQPGCWTTTNNSMDIWYSFVPKAPAVYIQLTGRYNNVGTLNQPLMAVYEGRCNDLNLLSCQFVSLGVAFMELTLSNLVVGQVYYIRVSAGNNNTGSFQLCIDSFVPKPSPEADCVDAVILCDKSPFRVDFLNTPGNNTNEVDGTCIGGERASSWYKWTCDQPGTLTFVLTPNNPNNIEEDLDFALFELPNGISDCGNKNLVRCMASGQTGGCPFNVWEICVGPTGLRDGSTDIQEDPGCYRNHPCATFPGRGIPPQFDDNFLAPLEMEAGKSYALVINNFSESGFGFNIEFGGTGTFLGPEVDFEIEALQEFECDKTIIFNDLSSSQTDPIVSYTWNFGAGASQSFNTEPGPHEVIYESFGDKIAALTVQTSRGCLVTKIEEFFIEACCADTTNLAVTAETTDLRCFGIAEGVILASGSAGSPDYQFSLDGVNFVPTPFFLNMDAGEYFVYIQDQKGCTNRTDVFIDQPPPLEVDAGLDQTIELGDSIDIVGRFFPFTNDYQAFWSPAQFTRDANSLFTNKKPVRTTTFTLRIINENGCEEEAEVTIFVTVNREIIAPNIILGGDFGQNSWFNITAGKSAWRIDRLLIFDRWGNPVYDEVNLPLAGEGRGNVSGQGWNGTYRNGVPVEQGVYAWVAEVRFLDDVVEVYKGDVTVVRNSR
jgi:hypothetical protein